MNEFYNPIWFEGGRGFPYLTHSPEQRDDPFGVYLRVRQVIREETLTTDSKGPPKRQYPLLYERAVPIALGIVVFAIIILMLIIASSTVRSYNINE
ncbi:MAG TPA: hypothetical protein G4O14_05045 [Anaerolineae bacterium]|nr:hypothetical protein [Anaerolineae bacterium]